MRQFTDTWFGIGIATVAVALGYLVGSSNSPVAGSAITAIFGLGVSVVGLLKDYLVNRESTNAGTPSSKAFRSMGIVLTIFSVTYVAAIVASSSLRARLSQPPAVPIPWSDKNAL
jgi:uncharacterized oligopeptide transporter (OPT) family protein